MKEYLVIFHKEGYAQTSACDVMTISAKDPLFLKTKIEKIMADNNYTGFCFAKKENVCDKGILDFYSLKNIYETRFALVE